MKRKQTRLFFLNSSRATVYTDETGRYRFEYNPPDHIHMRISAEGYRTIGVNNYHPNRQAEGMFDILLSRNTSKRKPLCNEDDVTPSGF